MLTMRTVLKGGEGWEVDAGGWVRWSKTPRRGEGWKVVLYSRDVRSIRALFDNLKFR